MYLKSLTLKGFKSFADKVVVNLEPGMTAIVGPNGSGKSNISDAVLWVLGERNAKHLRGSAMEDVIFAGSSARKAVSLAEVELVLDNSDGTLPVEFGEISLMRRMYRSGESEYLINGTPARRMDFLDILHDSGIGTGTHSIISQGNLGAILQSRPLDRRALIEEAAGVLKHKQRKERSAKKLASMDERLERVKMIAHEVERQLKPLARKAKQAQQYQGLVDEVFQLDVALAAHDLRALQKSWDDIALQEKEYAARIDIEDVEVRDAQDKLHKFQNILHERGLYVGDLAQQRGNFHMLGESIARNIDRITDKTTGADKRILEARNSFFSTQKRVSYITGEIQELHEQKQDALLQKDEIASREAQAHLQLQEVRTQRQRHEEKQREVSAEIRSLERIIEESMTNLGAIQDAHTQHITQKSLHENRLNDLCEQLALAQEQLTQKQAITHETEDKLQKIIDEAYLLETEVEKQQEHVDSLRIQLDEAKITSAQTTGVIAAQEQVIQSLQSHNALAQTLKNHAQDTGVEHSTLAEHIQVTPMWEAAVEYILGADLTSMVLGDARATLELAQKAKQSAQSGATSIFYTDNVSAEVSRQAGKRLIDEISCESSMRNMLEVILGDIYIVDTAKQALECSAGARYISADGVLVWPGVKMEIFTAEDNNEGILARKRMLEQLRTRYHDMTVHVESLEKQLEVEQATLDRKQAMSLELSRTQAQQAGACESATREVEQLAQQVGALEASIASLNGDLSRLQVKLEDVEPQVQALQEKISTSREKLDELRNFAHTTDDERAALLTQEDTHQQACNDAHMQVVTLTERINSYVRHEQDKKNELERAQRALENYTKDYARSSLVAERGAHIGDALVSIKTSLATLVEDLSRKAAYEQSNSEELNESIRMAQERLTAAQDTQSQAREALTDVRVQKGRLEVQLEQVLTHITADLEISVETALESEPLANIEQAKNESVKIHKKLNGMGGFDASAAQEYEQAQERYDYLISQIDDMQAARSALRKIVAAIDERMQQQFDVTFDAVNKNFTEIFEMLFPGGTGHLELVESGRDQEPLGVEVKAQPRGKRITNMSLMSGGEKSLVALALLFAVYRIRQTPFYILDEAEAALDDSNLRRLMSYLDILRTQAQLIMITHQRRTMEMADTLYGVSMQADGVTKVVSQKLDRLNKNEQHA